MKHETYPQFLKRIKGSCKEVKFLPQSPHIEDCLRLVTKGETQSDQPRLTRINPRNSLY
jgi:hypothetical protein